MTPTQDETADSAVEAAPPGNPVLRHVLLALAVLLAAVGGWSVSLRVMSSEEAPTGLGPMESIDQSAFAGVTGIWVEHVSLIGGGGLIEIRFRVLDVNKSYIIHDEVNPPRVITSDGFEISFTRMDHSSDRENRLGGIYTEQLVNLGNSVKRGDKVTVVVGTQELEGVIVQ